MLDNFERICSGMDYTIHCHEIESSFAGIWATIMRELDCHNLKYFLFYVLYLLVNKQYMSSVRPSRRCSV